LLAKKSENAAGCQNFHVIVDDLRYKVYVALIGASNRMLGFVYKTSPPIEQITLQNATVAATHRTEKCTC
jgi:hypothetical protein